MVCIPPTSFHSAMWTIAKATADSLPKTSRVISNIATFFSPPPAPPTKQTFNHKVNQILSVNGKSSKTETALQKLPQPIANIILQYVGTFSSPESRRFEESAKKLGLLIRIFERDAIFQPYHQLNHIDRYLGNALENMSFNWANHNRINLILSEASSGKKLGLSFSRDMILRSQYLKDEGAELITKGFSKIEQELNLYSSVEFLYARVGDWDPRSFSLLCWQGFVQYTKDKLEESLNPLMGQVSHLSFHKDLRLLGINPEGYPLDLYRRYDPSNALFVSDVQRLKSDFIVEINRNFSILMGTDTPFDDELVRIKSSDGDYIFHYGSTLDIVNGYTAEKRSTDEADELATIQSRARRNALDYRVAGNLKVYY